ncbi:MAG: coproporphyrinogen III oxidase family protein, partial [Acidobacteria bacterium]|nr:coproporphyrinogen III oxidase family protein [Acidobacteriota bacterium]
MKNQDELMKPSRKGFISNYPHFRYWKKPPVEELLEYEPVNIYIHVPFCAQKCAYCYYKTEQYRDPRQLEEFVRALCHEIRLAAQRFHFKERPVHAIYIGGGTPSLLKEKLLQEIVDCLRENFTIEGPEFSIEAEPRTITESKLKAYQDLGITRISLGIQSFDDEIIGMSGRKHSAEKALQAIQMIKNTSEDLVINIDLLSGLAGETDDTWLKTIDTAIKTGVHNITIYRMEAYLNTEFFNRGVRKKQIELPTEEQELHLMELALEKLAASPYKPWSFFTFTLNGEFKHHYAGNLWKGEDCCAFGPSAFGLLGPYNYQNTLNLDTYLESLKEDKLPIARGYKLTAKDTMIKDLLLGMKLYKLDRNYFKEKHGIDFCRVIPDTVAELSAGGYIEVDDHVVTLAAKG